MENEYTKQATDFLTKCRASIKIDFAGCAINSDWKETASRNSYNITITTQAGAMSFIFWDSIHNTEITHKTAAAYYEETYRRHYENATESERRRAAKELAQKKAEAVPTAYDVLACMTKSDPGTFEDFCTDYGYNEDSRTAERVYIAVVREYKQLERLFTPAQLEEMQKIQ